MRFARHYAFALVISGVIILMYESADLFKPEVRPWLFHVLIIIFISLPVTFVEHILKRQMKLYSRKINEMNEILRSEELNYRMLFENLPVGFLIGEVIDNEDDNTADFLCLEANRNFQQLAGKSSIELTGKSFTGIWPGCDRKLLARIALAGKTGESFNHEYYSVIFRKHLNLNIYSPGKRRIAIIFEDITARKQAEDTKLRLGKTARILLNASGSTYILVDATDFRILDINRAGTLLFGKSLESLKGADALILFSSFSALVPSKMKEAVTVAKTMRFQEEAGGKFYYDQVYPLKNDSGEVNRIAVFIEDITEIHQIKELTALNKELSELNKTKDRLFSVIGHDLKSPLTGILNLSGLLSRNFRSYGDEKTESYLKSIYNTSEQVITLLENLLVWAKSRRGQLDYIPEHIVLNQIIPEISDVFSPSAANKNIQIINNVSDDIICYADKNMLKSILRNLVQNSIKFTDAGGWVRIDASGNAEYTEISVEDNGVGFPDGAAFLPGGGSNLSTEGTANEKGTGLGLLLCHEFIEKHNGIINIKSEKNKGSRVTISLPAEMSNRE